MWGLRGDWWLLDLCCVTRQVVGPGVQEDQGCVGGAHETPEWKAHAPVSGTGVLLDGWSALVGVGYQLTVYEETLLF